jgi:hypothetical protein
MGRMQAGLSFVARPDQRTVNGIFGSHILQCAPHIGANRHASPCPQRAAPEYRWPCPEEPCGSANSGPVAGWISALGVGFKKNVQRAKANDIEAGSDLGVRAAGASTF